MTSARPLRAPNPRSRLRVVAGRRVHRAAFAPFVMFGVVVVLSMIGLVVARTSLDAGAFELTEMKKAIEEQERTQELLHLDIARLESPGRIAPLAEEMGMVLPDDRLVLLVEPADQSPAAPGEEITRLAMSEIGSGS